MCKSRTNPRRHYETIDLEIKPVKLSLLIAAKDEILQSLRTRYQALSHGVAWLCLHKYVYGAPYKILISAKLHIIDY